jgi:hypothetical protein
MYKLSAFHCLLHYILGRAIDTYDFTAVYGIWCHVYHLCPGLQELRNAPGFSPCAVSLFQLNFFFCTKQGYSNFCEKYTIEVLT